MTSFHSAREFLEAVDSLSPSPLIVDVRMPRMDGLQLIVELAKRKVTWPAIFLSGHGDVAIAVQAVKLGASDFLEKPVVAEELETCLENAFRILDSQLSTMQLRTQATQLWALLTPREVTVLDLLCEGHTNKKVAFQLGISPRTVEMHRASALRHLQIKSIPDAIKLKALANEGAS